MTDTITTKTTYIDPEPWITEAEMEESCCTPVSPPPCKKKVEPWDGYNSEEIAEKLGINIDENGLDKNGYPVRFLLVRPEGGSCGKKITTYEIVQQSCCEGVSALSWDSGTSISVLAPSASGIVGITGGKGQYTWNIIGSNISFEHGQKTIITNDKNIWVYAGSNFCGSAKIDVTDICGNNTKGWVKSTVGQWVLTDYDPCHYPGCGEFIYLQSTTCITENYKVSQTNFSNNSYNCFNCSTEQVQYFADLLCQLSPVEQPCFDIPVSWHPCGNGNYWIYTGSTVILIKFKDYMAYEWRC